MKTLTLFAAAAAVALAASPAAADFIYTPNPAAAAQEGNLNDGVFQHGDTHQQWVFDASMFGDEPLQIDGVSFRFDSRFTNQFGNSGTFDVGSTFKITLATLAGDPSTTFADNLIGRRRVLAGSQQIPYVVGGLAGQTKPWGVQITFAHPYVYDPANGDLVFDIIVPGQQNFGTFDATSNPLERTLFAPNTVALTSTLLAEGPVVRFDVEAPPPVGVPEPASWALMIVGFGAAGTLLRKRRRAQLA